MRVGDRVPDFSVDYWERGAREPQRMALTDHAGKWLVLFFYPRDFTFICPTEISALAALQDQFAAEAALVVAASTDSFLSHNAWFAQDERLADVDFPVIADTSHALASYFDVLGDDGTALRATFIIGPRGTVRHMAVNEIDVGRNVEEILRILRGLRCGELCPAGWQPGAATGSTYSDWLARVFPRLSTSVLAGAGGQLQTVGYAVGDIIVRQGDRADRFYIIVEGEVEVVHLTDRGEEVELARLGPGEMFGEMGILLEARRTADVRANTAVSLLALDWDDFKALVSASDQTARDFMRIVEQRRASFPG